MCTPRSRSGATARHRRGCCSATRSATRSQTRSSPSSSVAHRNRSRAPSCVTCSRASAPWREIEQALGATRSSSAASGSSGDDTGGRPAELIVLAAPEEPASEPALPVVLEAVPARRDLAAAVLALLARAERRRRSRAPSSSRRSTRELLKLAIALATPTGTRPSGPTSVTASRAALTVALKAVREAA